MKVTIKKYPGGEVYLLGAGAALPAGIYGAEITDPPLKTPGQLAYEAWFAGRTLKAPEWAVLPPETRAPWEAAAKAARGAP